MKKITALAFLSVLLFAASAFGQSPDKILKQAAKSLGGEKALKAVTSKRATGRITQQSNGGVGNYLLHTSAPNLYFTSYEINGFGSSAAFNGKSGWQRDSRDGVRTLTGDAGRDFQAEAAYRAARWLNYKAEKSKITPGGKKDINGKSTNAVNLTTFKGSRIVLYFDAVTGLPVREEFPNGGETKTVDYDDFRKTGAVMEPYSIVISVGEEKYDIKLDEVVHNTPVTRADLNFPKVSDEPLPDIQTLLKEVQANQDRVEEMLESYTFNETTVAREVAKDGSLIEKEAETNQITYYKGTPIRRMIEKNGKPLSPKDQEKEDKQVAERVEDLEKKIAKQERSGPPEEGQRVSIAEVLRASSLVNPRRERFRGRDVIVFDFEPNPAFDYKNAKSILKFFGKTAGVIWIDQKDKQVARLEAYLADSFSVAAGLFKLRKGASFSMEQDRVNDEIWLPFSRDINMSARVLLVRGLNFNQATKFSNYKKFKTEVKDAKVDEIKEQ